VPLLLVKLWSVYPRLFAWPPARDLAHALERLGILVLVMAAACELVTGVVNEARWYRALPFYFPVAHYWTAWIAIGGLSIHIGAKLPVIRDALRRGGPALDRGRRGILIAAASAVGVITLTTVGQAFRPLSRLDLLGQRRMDLGPQRLPVNKSA